VSRSSSPIRASHVAGRWIAALAAVCLLGVVGCTPAPTGEPASPSSSTSSAPPSSVAGLTIDITIADGSVTPNAEKIDVAKGTTVTLNVTSDQDDEIHAHTGGDGYELEVKAGQPATGSFVAGSTGSFEVESHQLDKVIAILNVR
jgi:hypothetical protein